MRKTLSKRLLVTAVSFSLFAAAFTGCANNNTANSSTANSNAANNDSADNPETEQSGETVGKIDYSALSEEELQALYEQEPASQRTINIAYNGGICMATMPIAQYKGFFEEEGLKTELVVSDNSRDALAAGKIDTAVGMISEWLTSIQNGVDIQFTLAVHTGCLAVAVSADSDITQLEAGQKIGVSGAIGGPAHVFGLRCAAHDGFVADDFDWRALDSSVLLSTLQSGDVDAVIGSDNLILGWEKEGLVKAIRIQATDDDFKEEACCVFGFPRQFIEENPATAYKITRALYKAGLWVEENKEEMVDICMEKGYVTGDKEFLLEVIKRYQFGLDFESLQSSLDSSVPEFVRLGILSAELDQEEFKKDLLVEYNFGDLGR